MGKALPTGKHVPCYAMRKLIACISVAALISTILGSYMADIFAEGTVPQQGMRYALFGLVLFLAMIRAIPPLSLLMVVATASFLASPDKLLEFDPLAPDFETKYQFGQVTFGETIIPLSFAWLLGSIVPTIVRLVERRRLSLPAPVWLLAVIASVAALPPLLNDAPGSAGGRFVSIKEIAFIGFILIGALDSDSVVGRKTTLGPFTRVVVMLLSIAFAGQIIRGWAAYLFVSVTPLLARALFTERRWLVGVSVLLGGIVVAGVGSFFLKMYLVTALVMLFASKVFKTLALSSWVLALSLGIVYTAVTYGVITVSNQGNTPAGMIQDASRSNIFDGGLESAVSGIAFKISEDRGLLWSTFLHEIGTRPLLWPPPGTPVPFLSSWYMGLWEHGPHNALLRLVFNFGPGLGGVMAFLVLTVFARFIKATAAWPDRSQRELLCGVVVFILIGLLAGDYALHEKLGGVVWYVVGLTIGDTNILRGVAPPSIGARFSVK